MPLCADDDMIVHRDIEALSRLGNGAGNLDIGAAGRRIARRMVMDKDDRGSGELVAEATAEAPTDAAEAPKPPPRHRSHSGETNTPPRGVTRPVHPPKDAARQPTPKWAATAPKNHP